MLFSLSLCSTRSKALSGTSWRFALGKPGISTPRASMCFQPSSCVAAICASIVLPASSPMPVRVITIECLTTVEHESTASADSWFYSVMEGFREIIVRDFNDFLFKLRFGDQLLKLLFISRAVDRQFHRLANQ